MIENIKECNSLTAEEAAVYDRQIRLWGVEAQQRLRKSKVLLVGMSSLGNEVCKNILLAGIKHMTILDDKILTEQDLNLQFFATKDEIGKNRAESSLKRAKELNPMVDIIADKRNIQEKSEDFFKSFDIVCTCDQPTTIQIEVNEICHRLGVNFLSGNIFGYYGYMFSDLGTHQYMEEKPIKPEPSEGPSSEKKKKNEPSETEFEEKTSEFCTLDEALKVPLFKDKTLRQAKQVSKSYLVMKVLLEYQKRHGEFPTKLDSNQKLEKLLDVQSDVFEEMNVDNDLLPTEFASRCVGTLFPVCPIVGGVMAQEVVKAVSGKDSPHNNFFFYDGVATSGVVENISKRTCVKSIQCEEKMKVTANEIVL